jgi:hypothetical protein
MDKQELPINNPAERLYVILTRMAENNSRMTVIEAFCNAIEMDTNVENFTQGIVESFTSLKNMEEQVEKNFPSRKHQACLVMINNIKNFISCVLMHNKEKWIDYQTSSNRCDLPDLHILNSYVYDFEEYGIKYGFTINKDLLNELINNVDAWLLEIQKSEFDESVKEFLMSTFMEINNLLQKYYDCGSQRIETEILAAITKITLFSKNLTAENKSILDKSSEKLLKMLDFFIKPVSAYFLGEKLFSEAIHPIMTEVIDKAQHFLPPGS